MSDSNKKNQHWTERNNKFKKNAVQRMGRMNRLGEGADDHFDWRQELKRVEVEQEQK